MNKSKYEGYEDAIVLLLTSNNNVYEAKALPDNEAEYSRDFSKPQVYVCYVGSDFGEDESTDVVIQDETVNIDVLFRVKKRRGENGLLSVVSNVITRLLGHKLTNSKSKIKLVRKGYVDTTSVANNWQYVVSFSLKSGMVEDLPEVVEPLIKQIEFDETV